MIRSGVTPALLLVACSASGCVREARRADLRALYPVDRARAAVQLADRGDAGAVHELVEMLDDEDAAVRMYAILALEHMCGDNLGYSYHDPEPDRQQAIERWRDALRSGDLRVRPRQAIGAGRTIREPGSTHATVTRAT